MLINTVLVQHMQANRLPVRLLPERELASYSWPELLSTHPDALQTIAQLLKIPYCATAEALDAQYTPHLSPAANESDFEYDQRLGGYLEHGYFPAHAGATILSGQASVATTVYVCANPLLRVLDRHADSTFVLVPAEIITGILQGTRLESSVIAPYSEVESIDVWINKLIAASYAQGAADVEITSHVSSIKIRFKILGEWGGWVGSLPLGQRGAFLRALCASATPSLDYESGTDHDFKLEKRIQGIDTSWRGSITPAALGDSVTLRMLPGIGRVPLLDELGYDEQACKLLRAAKVRRDGLILVTGSTGHGKTTTLYSLVTEMRDENRKVFTVEQPIELVIPGTIQKSVLDDPNIDHKYRVTFSSAIRTALRHAPDVLVVGETRDTETAQAAVGASRTGHLTFTTLHTTNVRISIKRMIDLCIDPLNLADTLTLVISQNLVRKLCVNCRVEHANGVCSLKPGGCPQCKGRGFIGRTVVYEMLSLDDESREAIIEGKLEREFPRLEKEGLYISKKTVATALWTSGVVDARDVDEFLHV
jgi:type II secretory ATPase GspE/PulE/Tfp pilus assembly ATPase PilB-like protein